MRVFFDSSAFAKRYIRELGTAEVLHWCSEATELVLSATALPELVSAFCRLRREGSVSAQQYEQIKGDLLQDVADVLICETTPDVVHLAINVLEIYPLRGMDAIHIASALAVSADVFVSADIRQCNAATQLGLRVVALSV